MTDYVTQGTVRVTTAANTDSVVITINPNQDYAVKHNNMNYIIFMPNGASAGASALDVKIFKAPKEIENLPVTNVALVQALINAAFNKINIEIMVEIDGSYVKKIKTITIPATF